MKQPYYHANAWRALMEGLPSGNAGRPVGATQALKSDAVRVAPGVTSPQPPNTPGAGTAQKRYKTWDIEASLAARRLIEQSGLSPSEVARLAHITTQKMIHQFITDRTMILREHTARRIIDGIREAVK